MCNRHHQDCYSFCESLWTFICHCYWVGGGCKVYSNSKIIPSEAPNKSPPQLHQVVCSTGYLYPLDIPHVQWKQSWQSWGWVVKDIKLNTNKWWYLNPWLKSVRQTTSGTTDFFRQFSPKRTTWREDAECGICGIFPPGICVFQPKKKKTNKVATTPTTRWASTGQLYVGAHSSTKIGVKKRPSYPMYLSAIKKGPYMSLRS